MLWQYQYLKYRIGDRVKIKDNLNEGILRDSDGRAIAYISSNMLNFQNTLTTITDVNVNGINDGYILEIDGGEWLWHEALLEKQSVNKYRIK